MASLKEVKTRIASVNSTRKITSAMKMVASSKLHRAQQNIESMRPYETRLDKIMTTFVDNLEGSISSPYAVKREIRRVAIVVYTSNSSLCGAFNGNTVKTLRRTVERYRKAGTGIARVYCIGKKGLEAARKFGFSDVRDHSALLDHPAYEPAARIAAELMELYAAAEIDHVEMIYHHFKNTASQILTEETFLPIRLGAEEEGAGKQEKSIVTEDTADHIIEPSREELVEQLIPKALHLKLYTALLDSLASEHAARVIAMQVATDNADDLLRELTLTYNKTRQQAITAELLDLVGGSMQ